MKLFIIFAVIFIIFNVIHCQTEGEGVVDEEDSDESRPSKDKGVDTLKPTSGSGKGLVDRIRNRFSSRRDRHSRRHIDRLHRKAIESTERLKYYANRKAKSASDPALREYFKNLSEATDSMLESMKNLLISVETKGSVPKEESPKLE